MKSYGNIIGVKEGFKMMYSQTDDYLEHYGIKGMKWGVRRTEEQLERVRGRPQKLSSNDKVITKRKAERANRRTMSDADLKKRIERLKLEKEFKDLTDQDISPGKKYVSDVLSSSGKRFLTSAAAGAMAYAVKAAMTKHFDVREAAGYIASNPNKKK